MLKAIYFLRLSQKRKEFVAIVDDLSNILLILNFYFIAMKKGLLFLFSAFFLFSFAGAAVMDTQIEDALAKKQQAEMLKNTKDLDQKLTFDQVSSCESMDKVLGKFLETYKKLYPEQRYPYYYDREMLAMDSVVTESVSQNGAQNNSAIQSVVPSAAGTKDAGSPEYSTTNLQKVGVDEPDLLKSNGDYLFYYVERDAANNAYVAVVKTPKNADLQDAELVKKISIPSSLNGVQLFLQGDHLVILANRYSEYSTDSVLGNTHTVAIFYNIKDMDNLFLEKMIDVNGNFQDARIVDGQLYLISNMYLDWYRIAYPENPILFNDLVPTTTQFTLKDATTTLNHQSYAKQEYQLPCNSVFYLFPSEESMKQL